MRGSVGPFRSLRYRNAQLFFAGLAVSNVGTWMQGTALAWLVFELSGGSGTALGVVTALQFLPMLLLGAWAGAVADQHNRRRMAIVTQTALAVQALVLAVVVLAGAASLAVLYALALVLGIASALDNPARRGLVTELVPETDLVNAVSLNTAVMTGSRIFGPALAGLLLGVLGAGWLFLLNALSFVAVLAALLLMDPGELRVAPPAPAGGTPVRDGLRFVWGDPTLRLVFAVMVVVSTFAFNYQVAMPKLVRSLDGGASAFGWLLAVTSVGSLLGSLLTASRRTVTLRYYLGAAVVLGLGAVAVAASPSLAWASVFAVPLGVGGAAFVAGSNGLTQPLTPPPMRGRVLALSAVAFLGSTPIGGPITGWVGDTFGGAWSIAYGGVIAIVTAVGAAVWARARARQPVATVAVPAQP